MAKLWKPDPTAPLEGNEQVGRRIFDESRLKGIGVQPNLGIPNVEHFREKRCSEVSLDRLGRTSVERKVRDYLLPRCSWQGGKFSKPKKFDGWAVIKVKDLTNKWEELPKWDVRASPHGLQQNEKYSDNDYHADAICSVNNSDLQNALFLRHLFERYGRLEILQPDQDAPNGINLLLNYVINFMRRFILRGE